MRDPLDFTQFTTDSGLRVFHHANDAPAVETLLVYCVGHVDDPIGKEGCAHLLEHLLHAGTEGYPYSNGTELRIWLEDQLFDFNGSASTSLINMQFPGTCTVEQVTDWLTFLHDFTLKPSFEQDIEHERAIIRHERLEKGDRSRTLKIEKLRDEAFGSAGNRYSTATGFPEDEILQAITLSDLRQMHRDYFHPSNALLFSYGGHSDEEWRERVQAVFSREVRSWTPPKRPTPPLVRLPLPQERKISAEDGKPVERFAIRFCWLNTRYLGFEMAVALNLLRLELHDQLREKRRSVYSVQVNAHTTSRASSFMIEARTDPLNLHTVRRGIEEVLLNPARCGMHLPRLKKRLRKGEILWMESWADLMDRALCDYTVNGRIQLKAQSIKEFEEVTQGRFEAFVRNYLDPAKAYVEIIENP